MAYVHVTDFKFGMDRRRKRVAGVPGTLWLGKNCHISRGGDIERAKAFVDTYSLEGLNTLGFAAVRNQLYVFGTTTRPATLSTDIEYQQLTSPNSALLAKILDAKPIDGKLYVIARYADGNVYHFYDGARVTSWDSVVSSGGSLVNTAVELAALVNANAAVTASAASNVVTITAIDNDTSFTTTALATNGGTIADESAVVTNYQARAAAHAAIAGYTTIQITGGSSSPGVNRITTVGYHSGVTPVLFSSYTANVNWATSNTATAIALAASINGNGTMALFGITASALGDTVTVNNTSSGSLTFTALTGGDVTVSVTQVAGIPASDAVPQIDKVTLGGTWEAADSYTISINGTDYTVVGSASLTGESIFANQKRAWSTANSLWRYSKVATPTDWTDAGPAAGAGFINVASDSGGADKLVGGARFNTLSVVFSRQNAYLYNIGTDAEDFTIAQTIEFTGARARRAILSYGNIDLFYLDNSGIRSLRARENTDTAIADDIGSMIDPFVLEYLDSLSDDVVEDAIFIMEPRDGRLWCIIGGRIFVFTQFRQSKISAWTYYEPDCAGVALTITEAVRVGQKLYVRADDDHIYLYGGEDGATYPDDDEMPVTVSLPFLTAQTPATIKSMTGFDIACTGKWQATLLVDPTDETKTINAGFYTETNYHKPAASYPGLSTHMALDLTCSKAGEASVSSVALHYEPVEAR